MDDRLDKFFFSMLVDGIAASKNLSIGTAFLHHIVNSHGGIIQKVENTKI